MSAAAFAAVFAALFVGHSVGDHWVQTHHQATHKGIPGRAGRWACAKHVTTLAATQAACLVAVVACTSLSLSPWWTAAGLAANAGTHYWADRRTTLERLAAALEWRMGKASFAALGAGQGHLGTGAYALDQAWHHGWLLAAALLAAQGGGA